jgi:hypothetical protein
MVVHNRSGFDPTADEDLTGLLPNSDPHENRYLWCTARGWLRYGVAVTRSGQQQFAEAPAPRRCVRSWDVAGPVAATR